MNVGPLKVVLAGYSEREHLVAEIVLGREQVAEVAHEAPGIFTIEIFPKPAGGLWSFDLDAFQLALKDAAAALTERFEPTQDSELR